MTYETGPDGVLLPAVCSQIADNYLLSDTLPPVFVKSHWGNTVWLGAQAQHQADIEVVRSVENIGDKEGYEYSDAPLHDILEDFRAKVLEALGVVENG